MVRERVGPDLTLVGVGGISTAADARERLDAGADLRPGLHRLRLRGRAVAAHARRGAVVGMTSEPTGVPAVRGPVHVVGEVLATKRAGAYRHLTIAAPGVPERFRAGNFVAVSVGDGRLARRPLWIHRVKETGAYGPTLDVVVEPRGPGSTWLAELPVGAPAPGHRPAGAAVRAAPRAGVLRAGRRGVRRGAALPARRPAARARLPRHAGPRAPTTRATCSPRWRPGAAPARSA